MFGQAQQADGFGHGGLAVHGMENQIPGCCSVIRVAAATRVCDKNEVRVVRQGVDGRVQVALRFCDRQKATDGIVHHLDISSMVRRENGARVFATDRVPA
jgi:hypothetical protein